MTTINWVQLLVPVASIFVAIVSAGLSYYFTKRSQIAADGRRLKEEYYLNFIKAVSNIVISNDSDIAMDQLADKQNQLLLIGSSEVVRNLMIFHNYVKQSNVEKRSDKHDELLTNLIKSMRKDLYKNRKVKDDYPVIHLSGKGQKK